MSSPTRRLFHLIRCIEQVRKLCRTVVRRHPRGAMTQEVLAVLEGHPCRPQAPAISVAQVVHPHVSVPRGAIR
jgi:hypothetical protein